MDLATEQTKEPCEFGIFRLSMSGQNHTVVVRASDAGLTLGNGQSGARTITTDVVWERDARLTGKAARRGQRGFAADG